MSRVVVVDIIDEPDISPETILVGARLSDIAAVLGRFADAWGGAVREAFAVMLRHFEEFGRALTRIAPPPSGLTAAEASDTMRRTVWVALHSDQGVSSPEALRRMMELDPNNSGVPGASYGRVSLSFRGSGVVTNGEAITFPSPVGSWQLRAYEYQRHLFEEATAPPVDRRTGRDWLVDRWGIEDETVTPEDPRWLREAGTLDTLLEFEELLDPGAIELYRKRHGS